MRLEGVVAAITQLAASVAQRVLPLAVSAATTRMMLGHLGRLRYVAERRG